MKTIRRLFFVLFLICCLPIAAFSGRYVPYFPNFNTQYIVRGVVLDNKIYYHSTYVDLYSPKIMILNDFDFGIGDTVVFVPDTIAITPYTDFSETAWYLKEGEEYYIDYRINKHNQICYRRFLEIKDGKVIGNLTNWNEFLIRRFRISPRGMSVNRFEKKLKKKLKKKQDRQ